MEKQLVDIRFTPGIRLTLARSREESKVDLVITQFIAYTPKEGFTRLRLTGGKTLDVKETTDQIDHLVRLAASERSSPFVDSSSSA